MHFQFVLKSDFLQALFQKGTKKICARATADGSAAGSVGKAMNLARKWHLCLNQLFPLRLWQRWQARASLFTQTDDRLCFSLHLKLAKPLHRDGWLSTMGNPRTLWKATAEFQPPRRLMISLELPWGADKAESWNIFFRISRIRMPITSQHWYKMIRHDCRNAMRFGFSNWDRYQRLQLRSFCPAGYSVLWKGASRKPACPAEVPRSHNVLHLAWLIHFDHVHNLTVNQLQTCDEATWWWGSIQQRHCQVEAANQLISASQLFSSDCVPDFLVPFCAGGWSFLEQWPKETEWLRWAGATEIVRRAMVNVNLSSVSHPLFRNEHEDLIDDDNNVSWFQCDWNWLTLTLRWGGGPANEWLWREQHVRSKSFSCAPQLCPEPILISSWTNLKATFYTDTAKTMSACYA